MQEGGCIAVKNHRPPLSRKSKSSEYALIQSVIHGTNACMVLTDAEGSIQEVNDPCAQLFMSKKEELIDKALSQLFTHSGQELIEAHQQLTDVESLELNLIKSLAPRGFLKVSVHIKVIYVDSQPYLLSTFKKSKLSKESQQELNWLYTAIEKSSNTMVITDISGAMLYVNYAHEKYTGFTKEESIGRKVRLFDPRFVPQKRINEIEKILFFGGQWKGNYSSQRKDGSVFNIKVTVSPIIDDAGNTEAFLFHTENNQRNTEAFDERSYNEGYFLGLINILDEGIIHYGEPGEIVFCNKRALEILEAGADELIGAPSEELRNRIYSKNNSPLLLDEFPSAIVRNTGGNLVDVIIRLKSKDGHSEKWLTSNATAEKDDFGKVVSVITTFRDVTESIKNKNEIKNLNERAQLAVEATGIGIWQRDFINGISYIDPVWAKATGVKEVCEDKQDWLTIIHPEDKAEVLNKIDDLMQGKAERFSATYRIKTTSNLWRWIYDEGVVNERDDQGNPINAIGTQIDVSEKVEVEYNLKRAQQIAKIGSFTYSFQKGYYTNFSEECYSFLGLDSSIRVNHEMISSSIYGIDTPLSRQEASQEFKKLKGGRSVEYDHRIVTNEGLKWVRVMCEPLFDVNKELIGYEGVVQNIHDRKIEALASAKTKELLSRTEKLGQIGSIMVSLLTKDVVWSENVYHLLGNSVKSKPSIDFLNVNDQGSQNALSKILSLKDGESTRLTILHQIKSEEKWIYVEFERTGEELIGMVQEVTEEVLSNKALTQSEEKYRFQSESLPHVLWTVDIEGKFMYLNQKGRVYFGLSEEEYSGLKWFKFLHVEDLDITSKKWDAAAKSKKQFTCQVRIENGNGIFRWFMISASPKLDATDSIASWMGIATDIHDQYLIQTSLKESEEKFRTIFEQGNDAMLVLKDGFCLDCNSQVKSIFGLECDEIRHELLWKFIPNHQLEGMASEQFIKGYVEETIQKGRSQFFCDVEKPNGELIHCEVNFSQIVIDGDSFILAVFKDVTARDKAQKELLVSKQRIELAIESGEIGTWELDVRSGETVYNEYWATMLGYTIEEVTHTQEFFNSIVHPEDLKRIDEVLQSEATFKRGGFELLIRVMGKDKKWRWILDRGRVVEIEKDERGAPLKMFGTHVDLTDIKERELMTLQTNLKYELAVTTAKSGVWEWDIVSDYVTWDKGMVSIYETDAEHFVVTHAFWNGIIDPNDLPNVQRSYDQLMLDKTDVDITFSIKTLKGNIKRIRSTAKIFQLDEEVSKIIGLNMDITESHLKDQALIDNGERLQLAFEGADMALMDWDLKKEEVSFSDNYLDIIGQDAGLYNPKHDEFFESILFPDDKEKVSTLFRELKTGKYRHYEVEYRVLSHKNRVIWLKSTGKAIVDANGNTRVISLTIDITTRKTAQIKLLENEHTLNLAIDGAKQIILDWNITTDIVELNHNYYSLTNLVKEKGELSIKDGLIVNVFNEDLEKVHDCFESLKKSGTNEIDIEFRLMAKENKIKWVRARGKNVEFETNGDPKRHLCTIMDITKIKELALSLEKSYEEYQSMVENIPGLVYSAEYPTRRLTFISPYIVKLTGFKVVDLIGRSLSQSLIHPDDRGYVESASNKAIKNKKAYQLNYRIIDKNDRVKWLSEFGHAIYSTEGNAEKIEGCVFDITDKIRAEENVIAAVLDASDKERSRISREIHDSLQQTLIIASLNLEFVKKEQHLLSEKVVERYERGWENLKKSLDQTREIAHRLMPKAIEDFGLITVVKDLVGELNATTEVDFQFISNFVDERLIVNIENSFYKIIQESVNNIIKHANAKTVTIQLIKLADSIQLTIEDDGKGFSLDEVDFNVTGFGLASMKNRASALSGEFIFDSFPGVGTSLIVNVPLTVS